MGTRSFISKKLDDGRYKYIYCHSYIKQVIKIKEYKLVKSVQYRTAKIKIYFHYSGGFEYVIMDGRGFERNGWYKTSEIALKTAKEYIDIERKNDI